MPIYEFYCSDCHRLFSFLARTIDTAARPACPRCGRAELPRRPSAFAISKGRPERDTSDAAEDPFAGVDDARLEHAMQSLSSEVETLDESDPRAQAQLVRRLFDATGLPVQGGLAEALRRLEAGEDPETVEAQMGDVLEGQESIGAAPRRGLSGLRRHLPPSVDPALYELVAPRPK
jgi:putative FmdB family regulatory protein